jgi:putative transposase
MYARGLSTEDVEDAFRDATGELLISKSAVSEITDQLWEDYQAFCARDLSEVADKNFWQTPESADQGR